ncbi:hypothetical protein AKJ36_02420 [candidate division MSBL1 archaeon SCGC-AAA259I07]|uniref:Uncharacterized protein n=1 Tax=candidate division MSBL1 archaeon SCGC-AAA259I07 TaxID=1698266 RepID=A0A133UKD7_9EURY|nr:hypothetical protein AKJ36_02420 [candidate division MSBL1 archaeon SCGC-AAA259I07]
MVLDLVLFSGNKELLVLYISDHNLEVFFSGIYGGREHFYSAIEGKRIKKLLTSWVSRPEL